ncbi:MAG: RNA methyltransferase, partial [Blastocatellia bacterium]
MMNHIYGLAPVLEALRAGRRPIHKILVAAGANPSRLNELTETARRARISIEKRDRRALDELTRNANHQGVVALVVEATAAAHVSDGKSARKASGYVEAETILNSLGPLPLLVLLDGIEDPHNLGAILRTCEGAGVDGIFIPEHRAAGLNETVAKTSAGAVEYVSVA